MPSPSTFRRADKFTPFKREFKRVPGYGPKPAKIMLIGERPGEEEAKRHDPRPFVGMSGQYLDIYLNVANLDRKAIYITNLVKDYQEYDKPTAEEIERDLPELMQELEDTDPEIIGLLGSFAVSHLLNKPKAEMEKVHGCPQVLEIGGRPRILLPMYHPAAGLYNSDVMGNVLDDFLRLAQIVDGEISPRIDPFAGRELYEEWTGGPFYTRDVAGVDTEGSAKRPWCVTFSIKPGTSLMVRKPARGSEFGNKIYLHNSLHDLGVLRSLGIHLQPGQFVDTMVLAYHLCIEPQGLKPLSYRHCGMEMHSYQELIAPASKQKAVEFMELVNSLEWPDVEPYIIIEAGKPKVKKPWNLSRLTTKALKDIADGKVDKDGVPVDIRDRWNNWDDVVKAPVIELIGDMPEATLDDVPIAEATYYANRDSDATLRVGPILEQKIKDMELEKAVGVDHDVIPMIDRMQEVGIALAGPEFWHDIERQCHAQMGKAKYKIFQMTGAEINPASGDQCAELLYKQLGLKPPKMTNSGKRGSTNDKSLEALLGVAPVVQHIQDYREADKVRGTYCLPLRRICTIGDRRVHANFRITRVSSGRLATSDPNLLAIPIRSALGKQVRGGFLAAEGRILGDWDLSQIEMRLMAHESRDPALCGVFDRDEDIHDQTSAKMFGVSIGNVKKFQRQAGKIVGFGIINGISAPGLVDQMILFRATKEDGSKWTQADCENMLDEWFKIYPGVKRFQNDTIAEAQATGLSRESISGRIRYLPAVWSPIGWVRGEAERQTYSHKIQGGAQAYMKIAMKRTWDVMLEAKRELPSMPWEPLLQIHDEQLHELAEDEWFWEMVDERVKWAMGGAVRLRVPVKADGGKGHTWLEAH